MWALVAGRTSVAEALRLIGEQMELERRSRGPEWTTGCLGVVNQCIFRFRGPWGVETNDLNVENDVEIFFPTLITRRDEFRDPAHVVAKSARSTAAHH